MSARVLVLGVGNPLLGDEGVGVVAIRELADRFRFGEDVRLLDGGTAGLGLTAEIARAGKLLILDAVRAGQPPGTVLRLDERDLPADFRNKISPHEIGLGEVLALHRLEGGVEEAVILGVEPDRIELGVGLSPPVRRALGTLIGKAVDQLSRWGVSVEASLARPAPPWAKAL